MPKLHCPCGHSINLSPVPNDDGFKLIWEPLIDKVIDEVIVAYQSAFSREAFESLVYDIVFLRKPELPQVYECSKRNNGEANSIRALVQKDKDNS